MFISKKKFEEYTLLPGYLKDYSNLPDSMKKSEVKEKIDEFLVGIDQSLLQWKFDQLYELADRQFYTYEKLDDETITRIETFILENVDYECYEVVDTVLAIIVRLGMKDLFNKIYLNLPNITNQSVKDVIIETKQGEFSKLDDPYSGYRKVK